jgi:hypothetical protein
MRHHGSRSPGSHGQRQDGGPDAAIIFVIDADPEHRHAGDGHHDNVAVIRRDRLPVARPQFPFFCFGVMLHDLCAGLIRGRVA